MYDEYLLIWITVLLIIVAIGVIMLVLVYQKKQLQFIHEKNQLQVAFEKEILESRLEIQEQTMKNISQELHDNVGQVLGLVRLNLLSVNYADAPALHEKINSSSRLLKQAIQDIRDLSKSLHTDIIRETGLIKSIENEFESLKKATDYNTSVIQVGEPYSLSHQHELILFRVFQEALNNITKHAQASAIVVKAFYTEKFVLEITDNGKGIDLLHANGNINSGVGMKSMRNRTRLIGADFDLISDAGSGTTIKITLGA